MESVYWSSARCCSVLAAFLFGSFLMALAFAADAAPPPLPLPDPATVEPLSPPGSLPESGFRTAPQFDPAQLVFEIPPVFQRPLGIDEGGRVFVREFVITGVIDDTEAGVLKAEIDERVRQRFEDLNQLLSRLRVSRQRQDEVGPDGFTPDEREAIIEFMSDVVRELSPDRQVEAYQAFVDQLRLQRLERSQGLTIGQLQLVADEITRYYREKGFFLARAVIPAQEVVDGIVVIRVLEGRLGGVQAQGNESYSVARLGDPFAPYVGELVTVDNIEDALLTLQAFPGLSAVGVFQPGSDVGTANMLVNVSGEESLEFLVRADNHGTRFTGEQRLLGEMTWNNPAGRADFLRLTALQTYEPENSLFGAIRYELPFANPRYRIGLDATRNTFDVANLTAANSGDEVGGVSEIASLYYRQNFLRSRARELGGRIDLSRKRAETETGSIVDLIELAVLGVQLDYESINSSAATISSAHVRLDGGLDGMLGTPSRDELLARGDVSDPVATDFLALSFGYSWLKSLTVNQTLLVRLNGQYSGDPLESLEQFPIGGPTTVRALPASQFLTDSGAFASIEWGIRAPGFADRPAFGNRNWGDVLRFTVFYDYAQGRYDDERTLGFGEERRIKAGGAGVGVEFGLPATFRLNLQWAKLTNGVDVESGDTTNPSAVLDDDQLWLDLTMEF